MFRKAVKFVALGYLVWSIFCSVALADDVSVSFVELLDDSGKAILVVDVTNDTTETITELTFGCWSEEGGKIDNDEVRGSSLSAFNTGPVTWAGELAPNTTATIRGVVEGFPGAMVVVFSGQTFGCGVTEI